MGSAGAAALALSSDGEIIRTDVSAMLSHM
jgi:hypothetical protein